MDLRGIFHGIYNPLQIFGVLNGCNEKGMHSVLELHPKVGRMGELSYLEDHPRRKQLVFVSGNGSSNHI